MNLREMKRVQLKRDPLIVCSGKKRSAFNGEVESEVVRI